MSAVRRRVDQPDRGRRCPRRGCRTRGRRAAGPAARRARRGRRSGGPRRSTAAASLGLDAAAVGGELEVGQHPAGGEELRPRTARCGWAAAACRCSRRRRRGRSPGRRRRGSRPADRPKLSAASTVGSAGLDPGEHQAVVLDGEHLGYVDAAGARPPRASAARRPRWGRSPSGACGRVLISADVPSDSRSRVAVQMSPPATGVVATTGGAEQRLGPLGDAAHPRHVSRRLRSVSLSRASAAPRAATRAVAGALDHREHVVEALVAAVVRVGHVAVVALAAPRGSKSRNISSRSVSSPCRRSAPRSAWLSPSIASTRSHVVEPVALELPRPVRGLRRTRGRSAVRRRAGPSGRRRASRRCRR